MYTSFFQGTKIELGMIIALGCSSSSVVVRGCKNHVAYFMSKYQCICDMSRKRASVIQKRHASIFLFIKSALANKESDLSF